VKQLVLAIGAVLIADCCQRCSVLYLSEWPCQTTALVARVQVQKGVERTLFGDEQRQHSAAQVSNGKRHKKVKDGE
jgi:hypothetical protein